MNSETGDKHKEGLLGEDQTFGTTTRELFPMIERLSAYGCIPVAMERTGLYWKLVCNLLEGTVEVISINAVHIKQVLGRKTDVKDCEWITQLFKHRVLCKIFIVPTPIRELRERSCYRFWAHSGEIF